MKFLLGQDGQLLADQLLKIKAIEVRDALQEMMSQGAAPAVETNFRTKDHPCPGPLDSWALKQIAEGLIGFLQETDICFDAVCGVPREGESLVQGLLHRLPSRVLQLAGDDEESLPARVTRVHHYGLPTGKRVLVVDDVIASAQTKLQAVGLLCESGYLVEDVLVVLDRQQGAAEQLAAQGVRLHSLFQERDIVEHVRRKSDPNLPAL